MTIELFPPASDRHDDNAKVFNLELKDGSIYQGYSFGTEKSISGELVFQTGMVGYPESLTDPSYQGQILVITFPLVGNYGVPSRKTMDSLLKDLPAHFESYRIHVAGIVVAGYCGEEFSHYLATSSLGVWLKEQNVPAMYGVDTRALTKRIRTKGSMLGRMLLQKKSDQNSLERHESKITLTNDNWKSSFEHVEWDNPNARNLVAEVSIETPKLYTPHPSAARKHSSGRTLRILCLDVGLKYNQLRCLLTRGAEVLVCPWNYDFLSKEKDYDGLFVSNGPGDPSMLQITSKHIAAALQQNRVPVFGICLGHQLLARAVGAQTTKMAFGNRGHNIPCTNLVTGKCHITSQNHGFAVVADTLPSDWKEVFINANDASNEGIMHVSKPHFSVQFHPESTPGPRDTEFLFDVFVDTVVACSENPSLLSSPIKFPGGTAEANELRNPRVDVKKVLILGSGGLSIGQAGEFDYSGSQAIKALKEEGIYTVLINPNIATIQTSRGLADKVYFLPVNTEFVRKVIKYERPDAIYVTFGGQTALQVGIQLKDEFESLGVKVLGTPIETIITTEDRELFARSMDSINEKCAKSASASSVDEAMKAVKDIGFPVIIRAAYALGGLGSGFANNEDELIDLCNKAFAASPQVLIERSMKGWKEIEYEVVRDAQDNCITVCNMENFDPLGIHTGDSIVVAPSQTLSDEDYNMLRTTAVNVIRHLGVVGECNIQYALNPFSKEYCIIEVNARLSRSSALASKATGYPLAFIAAKLGLGIPLKDIPNSVTKKTCACFEPSLDYVVVKMPRWDLKKFTRVSTTLGSSMKSVGEVMSIGRTFEEAIQKAIRAIDFHNLGFNEAPALLAIDDELQTPSDQRLFAIANAMHQGYTVDKIWEMTKIDKWFLHKLKGLSDFSRQMSSMNLSRVTPDILRRAKRLGFCDRQLAKFCSSNELAIRRKRIEAGITPFVKRIDTVAAEFPADTNYLYLTYNASEHDVSFNEHGFMVLGSGVYRIGSSVEFDWCSVRAIRTLRESGVKTIMVNYNPETVSTDYDEADKLYFENINVETILDIYQLEAAKGVLGAMGGQTPNNIALPLLRSGVKVLGTSPENIDNAENRYKFSRMLDTLGVDQPTWKELTSFEEAKLFCDKVSYPVLVRPSYVLSGAAMNTVYSERDLESYLNQAAAVSREHPVVITKYIENAKEIEMDAVAKDGIVVSHVISEHVENAGVHSGDATLILPPQDLEKTTIARIVDATRKIGKALNVTGPFNIQFIAKDNDIKVIECNVRASRSFPFVSKVMGVDLIEMATKAILGLPFVEYPPTTLKPGCVAVKVPQFSFSRLSGADPVLGVEMASTGEVACFGRDKYEAYLKALISTGFKIPRKNVLLSIGSYKDKKELLPSVQKLAQLGYKLFATSGTADFLAEHNTPVQFLEDFGKNQEQSRHPEHSLMHHLAKNMIDLYINLPSINKHRRPANYMSKGYQTRRMAVDYQIPLVTNVKNAKILVEAISRHSNLDVSSRDCQTSHATHTFPGLINVAAFIPGIVSAGSQDFQEITKASIAGGFAMIRIMPMGIDGAITNAESLAAARRSSKSGAYCDFNLSVTATSSNVDELRSLTADVGSLFLPFNNLAGRMCWQDAMAHFRAWPQHKPIITDARTPDLANMLLLASWHKRRIHVTCVSTKDDIELIALGKEQGHEVTCDVSVYSLYLSRKDYPQESRLPSIEDQAALWENMETIDAFSVGSLPYQLTRSLNKIGDATVGISDALPLLLNSVAQGKLTIDDIRLRLYENPVKIFELHEQPGWLVEVEIGRPWKVQAGPFAGQTLYGNVARVNFQDDLVCLDGKHFNVPGQGKDMSTHGSMPALPTTSPTIRPSTAMTSTSPRKPRRTSQLPPIRLPPGASPVIRAIGASEDIALPAAYSGLPPSPGLLSILSQKSAFKNSSLLSVAALDHQDVHLLFTVASEMRLRVQREGVLNILPGKVLCLLFYEPSTRTSASFDVAMQRLSGRTISISTSHSSAQKGESLYDSLRAVASYCDAIVLRHPEESSADIAKDINHPIINAGNGSKEHPTQALLDLFTIREELGTVHGLTITFVGDLLYGRTVHSLVHLLQHYKVSVQLVSPRALALPPDVRKRLVSSGKLLCESESLTPEIMRRTQVLYCTRIQKERFPSIEEYETVKNSYRVDNSTLKHVKGQKMIILHPLPRNEEIAEEVDTDPRAAYFRQMKHGLYLRMALLALMLYPEDQAPSAASGTAPVALPSASVVEDADAPSLSTLLSGFGVNIHRCEDKEPLFAYFFLERTQS